MKSSPIIIYDGECGLCQRSIQFILKFEANQELQFCSNQSTIAQEIIQQVDPNLNLDQLNSLVFARPTQASLSQSMNTPNRYELLTHSEAAVTVAKYLRRPWQFLALLSWIPKVIRDGGYKLIAKNRYLLGNPQNCLLLNPQQKLRFLDIQNQSESGQSGPP